MDDLRIGDLLVKSKGRVELNSVAILFHPSCEGVRRNGGRVGASKGPEVFVQHIQRTGALKNEEFSIDISDLVVSVVGDPKSRDCTLEEAHELLKNENLEVLKKGAFPFIVGGGNDGSYPNASALLEYSKDVVCCVNIDAHLDVRPLKEGKVHSGSPFRLLLEDNRFNPKNFTEFASQGMQCSAVHVEYLKNKGGNIVWLREAKSVGVKSAFKSVLQSFPEKSKIFVSFDLDAVAGRDAPGVSCPGATGISSEDAFDICFLAGSDKRVAMFDLSEFNPEIEAYRTGKLVAAMFYYFLLGYKTRNI